MSSPIGSLPVYPALERPDLLSASVAAAVRRLPAASRVGVASIHPGLADAAAFSQYYGGALEELTKCVIVVGKRAGTVVMAACLILATTRADMNGLVRRYLRARSVSLAPVDQIVSRTGMDLEGISPFGLPAGWPMLIDAAVTASPRVVVGSGLRLSKISVPGSLLTQLPDVTVLQGLGLS